MTLLEVSNLTTQFPTNKGKIKAVNGVDLTINEGEIVGLVGESGSGKSVLAKSIIQLLEEPGEIIEGDISLYGESLLSKSETELLKIRGNNISIVFQDPSTSLNPTLSVGEQIAESIRLHQDVGESVSFAAEMKRKLFGASKNTDSWIRAVDMLESVHIPEPQTRAKNYPHQFSGGMKQRAMIAIALACEPDLLILDEPTTGLDVTVQAQIIEEIRSLQEEYDTALLMITHDLAVVSEVCERVNVMYAGEIVEKASVEELFNNPQHPYTQGLIESTPKIDEPRAEMNPIPGNVPALINIPYACHFAPRCSESTMECFEEVPLFRRVGEEDHVAACHKRGEGWRGELRRCSPETGKGGSER
jgi:oligopeptide/dipeptide ABC transporter ATP-binding protein